MKLRINDKHTGQLTVFYGGKQYVTIDVPLDNLQDWYPLSNAYQYKLQRDRKHLELKRLRSELPSSYGISDNSRRTLTDPTRLCYTGTWVNQAVQADNMRIIRKAKKYDLPVITERFDSRIVDKGFENLGLIFNKLSQIVIDKYTEDMTESELKSFNLKSEDTQLALAFKKSGHKVDITYDELGQIYNMLVLMKKISNS